MSKHNKRSRPSTGRLQSFGVNPGGYIGFFDPQTGQTETYSMKGDAKATKRLGLKLKNRDCTHLSPSIPDVQPRRTD